MSDQQQRIRRRQHMETLCAATLRALSGEPRLQYRGRRLCIGDTPLAVGAPHLRVADDDDLAAYRGAADGLALRVLYSDTALHARLAPDAEVARLMFDWLEQFRVESLAPGHLPGLRHNLVDRFRAWSLAFVNARHTEGEIGELIYTVAQISWARLGGRAVLAETEDLIETRRGEIVSEIGHALAGLRRERRDQAAFAVHALAIANFVADHIHAVRNEMLEADDDDDRNRAAFSMLLDFDDDTGMSYAAALSGESAVLSQARQRYQVFTTAYDTEQPVTRYVRAEQLEMFRVQLDSALSELQVNQHRLARYFRTHLSVAERSGWRFGEEAGYIDGRRLSQIVTVPAERRVFRIEQDEPRSDTVVGLLIDCSGSMKAHSEYLALVIDRLVGALSMAGISSEIMGFTTGAWSGGRARQDWMKAGRPAYPGRLNERRHLLFKSSRLPWRRARHHIAALLKNDLYREGVDGEAVDWACTRLTAQAEARRILVVISDGCPMDSATQLANDRYYLDNHLKQVVARRTYESEIEIRGLGVGLDLSPFYPDSLIVDPQAPIDNRLLGEIAMLIAEPERSRLRSPVAARVGIK